jgi:hypothetical protein
VIGTAMIVLAILARPQHEPGIVAGCRLARLNVHVIGVHPRPAFPNVAHWIKIPNKFWRYFRHFDYPDKIKTKIMYFLKLESGLSWPVESAIFAENKDDVTKWFPDKVNPKAKDLGRSAFMHQLCKEDDPNNPLVLGSPILPLEPEYKSNITFVRG